MVKEKNVATVAELAAALAESSLVIATDFRGVTMADMTQLRREFRQRGVKYRVIKNTLGSLAAHQAGRPGLEGLLQGPTALAFVRGDFVVPTRAFVGYVRAGKTSLVIRGGLLDGRVLSAAEVMALASLPPREVLVGQLLGVLQTPLVRLVRVISAPLQGLVLVLEARRKQLEERGEHDN